MECPRTRSRSSKSFCLRIDVDVASDVGGTCRERGRPGAHAPKNIMVNVAGSQGEPPKNFHNHVRKGLGGGEIFREVGVGVCFGGAVW